ncbi:hypothetical protein C2E23DRAFT_470471 [Lenzites betulinus]|nr:hypothetical protein C2E23DRAFT_470471 [Lenzites betulinus]
MQPPSASQPLPSTPAYKGAASSKFAPPSTARSNAKNKATMRKRSENFWHLDGSVVIQIQNTLFRLHRSRLTQHSEYFMSLFSSGNGTRDSPAFVECDTIDSCPVYIVKGHLSVLDFERLLTALDAGIAYAIHPPPFHVLCSLIRAAHALSFKTILEFATHHLREMWPSDLARLRDRDPAEPATEQALRVAQATHTILLAQECELPELRKAAYHALLCARTQSFGQDLAVYVHAECADGARRAAVEREEDEENAPPARLAASDFVRLVNAEQRLRAEWLAIARAPPLPSAFPCPIEHQTHPENTAMHSEASLACKSARKVEARIWLPTLMEQGVFEAGMTDVFVGLQELADMDWKEMGYCMGCVSERRDAWMEKREKLWKKLDVFLGLKDED